MDKPVKFYGGTSGLQLPIPKRDFPPELADKQAIFLFDYRMLPYMSPHYCYSTNK